MASTAEIIAQTEAYGAANYHPLPVVLVKGEGVWVWDVEGKKYLDMLSCYSALSHGHRHPKVIAALKAQADEITLTSRAFHNDKLGQFYERVAKLTGLPRVLPMNSGAEAVETALKVARKWGYQVKRVPEGRAEIIACRNNFHGRTITVVSFSTEAEYRAGFGPFTPGFSIVPYNDLAAVEAAMTDHTVAFLVEPIQGEAGILIPSDGYLRDVAKLCKERNVLLICDEVQTGFGRTGKMFACEHEGVRPDVIVMGKALGGGVYPVSAIAATDEVMGVLRPGQHGSTFGGNPVAAAVGIAALDALVDENLTAKATEMGAYLTAKLRQLSSRHIKEIRGRGLLVGVDLKPEAGGARRYCEALMAEGMLCKETHESVIRLAPPLVITREEIDWAVERLARVLGN
ncbi:MAG: ornithine--oxo-acid transaminase [Deltaproteobacteria bacterium]|nr:ornithine--oxo-acid transaminase [Deltaproteobacteria bacterium]